MIPLTPPNEKLIDEFILDSGIACTYDGEPIQYTDLVIVLLMIKPYMVNGKVVFYDVVAEDKDYVYEPAFFHGKNWDEIEEELHSYVRETPPTQVANAVLQCSYCKSSILAGETTCVGLSGEIHRSQRNPDLEAYGNHFEPLDTPPIILCISCARCLNTDVTEIWPDGVNHDGECAEGTYVRCWRSGCTGICDNNKSESEE